MSDTSDMRDTRKKQLPQLEKIPTRTALDPAQRKQYIQHVRLHYEAGATIEELMALTNRGYTTIKTYLIESGATLRPKRTAIPPELRITLRAEMRTSYELGETMRQIADHYGYAESTVRTLLLEAKATPRGKAGMNARR